MDRHNAVLDASFWINAHEGHVVDYLSEYFNLFVPMTVVHEIEFMPPGVDRLMPAGDVLRRWRHTERLKVQDPKNPVDWLHPGENAAIGLAREREYVLLIDDQVPYHMAKARGLRVIASADFVILLHVDGKLSHQEAEAILARSGIARHIKRAALTALASLTRQRND